MPDIIKKCVTRYIVPFYFDNQNKGYAKILNLKIAKFNSTIHLYSGILFCTSGV